MDYELHTAFHSVDKPCVFAFAGGDGTRFEWHKFLTKIKVPHILFRDPFRNKLYNPVNCDFLECLITAKNSFNHTVALGLSSGAYGALMYGHKVFIDRIIAISPITGTGESVQEDFDSQWHDRIVNNSGIPIIDLKDMFKDGSRSDIKMFVSDGYGTELDLVMAERIHVGEIKMVRGHSHGLLARHLMEDGILTKLILEC